MSLETTLPLRAALNRFQRRWRLGLLASGVLAALFWAGLALLIFGAIDYLAGFSDPSRQVVAASLTVLAGAALFYALWELVHFVQRKAAREADRALGDPRRGVLSALELQREKGPAAPLAQWLRQRAIQGAAARVQSLETTLSVPRRQLWRGVWRVAAVGAAIVLCLIFAPGASRTIARRLLDPEADLPPFSPLRFAVSPAPAQVLYGGDLIVTVEITGGEIKAPVRCLTRDPGTGRVDEAPAFRETEARFSQKLEKVSSPVDVAFAVGRARSAWLPVAVRTQPKVQEVVLAIEPPGYTHLPRREFAAGTQPLALLAGSRVTARVGSNRPLSTGLLKLHGAVATAPAQEVAGELEDATHLRFTWTAKSAARLSLTINDVQNTASDLLEFEQKIIPDERPEVTLREPTGDVLATPDGELPLEYEASDDLGLARLALVRKLGGYRERAQNESVAEGSRRQEVRGKLNLTAYGLTPGQTIELNAEAADTNPTLLGVATSETARVHIITREQYATMLRRQTTLEEFSGRYTALQESMEEARKALAEMEKAAQSGDAAKAEEARRKALEAHQKAGEVFGAIAKDFPLFDLDQGLSDAAGDVMKRLFENAKDLESLAGQKPGEMSAAMPGLKQRLGESEKRMEGEMKRGERAAEAGKVMEEAGRFNEILQMQRDLVKDLNHIVESVRRGEMPPGQALGEMARRQEEAAGALRDFEKELGGALDKLPEEFSSMREDGRKFLEALKEFKVPDLMDAATGAAKAADSQKADAKAGEALASLEALLRRSNGFCKMCRGEQEKFPWPQDLSRTLEEMLEALIPKHGSGSGKPETGDSGTGFGGWNENGYTMKGQMPRMPVYGPPRLRTGREQAGGAVAGRGPKAGGSENPSNVQRDQVSAAEPHRAVGESVAPEAVPEAYRDAVKRYFSASDSNQNPP